jgi:hypothetical protein
MATIDSRRRRGATARCTAIKLDEHAVSMEIDGPLSQECTRCGSQPCFERCLWSGFDHKRHRHRDSRYRSPRSPPIPQTHPHRFTVNPRGEVQKNRWPRRHSQVSMLRVEILSFCRGEFEEIRIEFAYVFVEKVGFVRLDRSVQPVCSTDTLQVESIA